MSARRSIFSRINMLINGIITTFVNMLPDVE